MSLHACFNELLQLGKEVEALKNKGHSFSRVR